MPACAGWLGATEKGLNQTSTSSPTPKTHPAQVSLGEEEYRSQLEELGGRLSAVGMTAAYEERIAPELNAAWQVGREWAECRGPQLASKALLASAFMPPCFGFWWPQWYTAIHYSSIPLSAQLGCVAVVGPSARRRNLGDGFSLAELQMKPVVQVREGWVVACQQTALITALPGSTRDCWPLPAEC